MKRKTWLDDELALRVGFTAGMRRILSDVSRAESGTIPIEVGHLESGEPELARRI